VPIPCSWEAVTAWMKKNGPDTGASGKYRAIIVPLNARRPCGFRVDHVSAYEYSYTKKNVV
jgi:hypothetical protein